MPDNKYRQQPRNMIEAHNDVAKRLSRVERNPRIGNTAIDSGILSIKNGRIEIIDDNGNTVIQFGKFGDGLFGIRMLDGNGNIILDMGKDSGDLYSLRTNNAAGAIQARMGQLAGGGYGLEAVNATSQLVSLSSLAFGPSAASITAVDGSTSTSYGDLTNVGPTISDVNIGNSGKCIVIVTAKINYAAPGTIGVQPGGYMSFQISGATTLAPSDTRALISLLDSTNGANTMNFAGSASYLITGLNTGPHTFQAKYKVGDATITTSFLNRNLVVLPF